MPLLKHPTTVYLTYDKHKVLLNSLTLSKEILPYMEITIFFELLSKIKQMLHASGLVDNYRRWYHIEGMP